MMRRLFEAASEGIRGHTALLAVVSSVRNRWRLRMLLRGLAVVVGAAGVLFLVAAYGLEQFRFSTAAIVAFRAATYGILAVLIVWFLLRPLLRRVSDEQVALYIEEHEPTLQGQVVSAIEFGGRGHGGDALSPVLIRRLVERAVDACRAVDDGRRIERPRLVRSSGWLAGATLTGAMLLLVNPGIIRQGVPFLLRPWSTGAGDSPYSIVVTPGDATVPRGADLKVTAGLVNFDADAVYLSVKSGEEVEWERWPMIIDDETGEFTFVLFSLQDDAEYLVEAAGVRSGQFHVDVTDLPYVDRIDLEYRFPAYTGLSPRHYEDAGDIAALRGTRVHFTVTPTIQVSAGAIVVDERDTIPLDLGESGLTGVLRVRRNGSYRIVLTNIEGTDVVASPDYFIDVLIDQPPAIRFRKPGRDLKVTSIDEVFVEVTAEDDYGVAGLQLVYAVNGGEERSVALYGPAKARKRLTAGHTLYLEEFGLEVGDVVSYYARATDGTRSAGAQTTTTDIYFLDIRPFDLRYRQAESQGGGGGGAGVGELSMRQRQIVAATFNLVRDSSSYSDAELRENLAMLVLAQGRLREEVATLIRRMEGRRVVELDSTFQSVAEALPEALGEMEAAEERLGRRRPDDALSPEQRALRHLMRAEAAYRERQVTQGGGGGGGSASAEELADLFDLELDKLRNQYESVERSERREADQQLDEALEKLRELARRQQQENERMRVRAQSQVSAGGGGQGRGQRRLAEGAEELARQLERLSRQQQRSELQETARRIREAAEAMRRAAASERTGSAQGGLALDRLREARRSLEENRAAGLRQDVEDALRLAERLAARQRDVAGTVARLPEDPGLRLDQAGRLVERKDQMAEEVRDLEAQIDRLSRDARADQPEASRQLREAARGMRDTRLADKILYSRGGIQARSTDYIRNFEAQIQADLDELEERLRAARDAIGESREQQLNRSLDQARDLVNALESMGQRMDQARRQEGQQGQEGPEGPAGQGEGRGQLWPDDARQFAGEMVVRRRELEDLRRELRDGGVDVAALDDLIRRMRALESRRRIGDPMGLTDLKDAIIPGLKEFEFRLRRQLVGADDRAFYTGSEEVPARYRRLVEEYYKALSREGGGRP